MQKSYDVIVIGAGTAGSYFAKLMAEQGYSVLVVEKSSREKLGRRLDIFHLDRDRLPRFGIPAPAPGDDDYVSEFEYSISKSAFDQYPKRTLYPFLVLRLPQFLARLARWAESFGVEYAFETEFLDFIYEGGRICGAQLKQGEETVQVFSRLVADASGIVSVGRRKLPEDYGVETFEIGPRDKFYVILRYARLKHPEVDRVKCTVNWPYYKTWIGPQHDKDGAIIGVGANFSYEYAEEVFQKFIKQVKLPPHELQYIQKGTTPYRRPPYSFVADGFVVLGDAACLTKPYSGEGITSAWELCAIAAQEFGAAMKEGRYPEAARVWKTNVRYQRGQGAKFAYIMATLVGAVNTLPEENDYQFRTGIVFNEKDMTTMNRNFGVTLGLGDIMAMVFKIVAGVLTRNITLATVKALLRSVTAAGKIQKHYEKFPEEISAFKAWCREADKLWAAAGSMADVAKS